MLNVLNQKRWVNQGTFAKSCCQDALTASQMPPMLVAVGPSEVLTAQRACCIVRRSHANAALPRGDVNRKNL